ncbi:hypothetical protein HDU92_004421 [Lobulomyces angularis]|nr:hypothetical protein HDU92_004421 [Lobulomyces angularis]
MRLRPKRQKNLRSEHPCNNIIRINSDFLISIQNFQTVSPNYISEQIEIISTPDVGASNYQNNYFSTIKPTEKEIERDLLSQENIHKKLEKTEKGTRIREQEILKYQIYKRDLEKDRLVQEEINSQNKLKTEDDTEEEEEAEDEKDINAKDESDESNSNRVIFSGQELKPSLKTLKDLESILKTGVKGNFIRKLTVIENQLKFFQLNPDELPYKICSPTKNSNKQFVENEIKKSSDTENKNTMQQQSQSVLKKIRTRSTTSTSKPKDTISFERISDSFTLFNSNDKDSIRTLVKNSTTKIDLFLVLESDFDLNNEEVFNSDYYTEMDLTSFNNSCKPVLLKKNTMFFRLSFFNTSNRSEISLKLKPILSNRLKNFTNNENSTVFSPTMMVLIKFNLLLMRNFVEFFSLTPAL